jgi:hypothetical protein
LTFLEFAVALLRAHVFTSLTTVSYSQNTVAVLNVTGIDLYETNATVAANITKGVLPRAHLCPLRRSEAFA